MPAFAASAITGFSAVSETGSIRIASTFCEIMSSIAAICFCTSGPELLTISSTSSA